MENILSLVAAGLYTLSGFLTGYRLLGNQQQKLPRKLPIALGFVALLIHAFLLNQGIVLSVGYNLGIFNAASLIAFVISMMLLISSLNKPVENLGIIILPIAALTLILQIRYPGFHLLDTLASWGLKVHVLISLLAYSLLTLASAQAILLAILDKKLHDRKTGAFVRAMPPLQTMEKLLFEMILVGFIFLTAALLSGFIYLDDMFMQKVAHKTVLSILSWVFFGVLLYGRFKFGWRGKKAIRWTLGGFATLMLAYFGTKAVLELVLQ